MKTLTNLTMGNKVTQNKVFIISFIAAVIIVALLVATGNLHIKID